MKYRALFLFLKSQQNFKLSSAVSYTWSLMSSNAIFRVFYWKTDEFYHRQAMRDQEFFWCSQGLKFGPIPNGI